MAKERRVAGGRRRLALVVEESEVEIKRLHSNLAHSLSSTFDIQTYPLFCIPSFRSSYGIVIRFADRQRAFGTRLAITPAQLSNRGGTRSMTLQCLALKCQIEQVKASVVEERMKQQVCTDEIARLKEMAAPRRSGSKQHIRDSFHSSLGLEI
jgi:hypothetical protein